MALALEREKKMSINSNNKRNFYSALALKIKINPKVCTKFMPFPPGHIIVELCADTVLHS